MLVLLSMNLQEKQRQRQRIKELLRNMPDHEHRRQSAAIRLQLESWRPWQVAQEVCLFHPLASEPSYLDPWPLEKKLLFPKIDGSALLFYHVKSRCELLAGPFGVLEPSAVSPAADSNEGLILVPGLAFDRRGMRLGRGGGFYDRLLESFSGTKVGICFEEQLLEGVPVEPHDMAVDYLVTPSGILACAH
jgi:5-formyltetrahydrofolate cyclo-ligase